MITLGKRKIKPTVYFPLELEKDKYVGKIYGLHIENSNHYNIVTTKSDSNYSNLIELGEIVENKPLARMLYANVEIGAQIPPELYQAVAEVLAFVYHAKGRI